MLALVLVIVLAGTVALLGSATRTDIEHSLQDALGTASSHYRAGTGLRTNKRSGERVAQQKEKEMVALAQRKRRLRLEVAALRAVVLQLKNEHGLDISTPDLAEAALSRERENIGGFILYLYARHALTEQTGLRMGREILERTMHASLGDTVERQQRQDVLAQARARLFSFLVNVRDIPDRLLAAEADLADAQEQYLQTIEEYEYAVKTAHVSQARLAEIQRITSEVHDEVFRLQGELARIDARIARRTERALIEKGLRSAQPGTHSDGEAWLQGPLFSWPVYGPISAGFHSESYAHYFGVPHKGMDIVVGQGTTVRSAADGVVFLVRDGGQTGYSYILIGHRGGYATLYGHLSGFSVTAGQDVSAGDPIGLSGGEPGTYGAGPMTTGAHLHFEVILNGANVNPRGLLP